MIIFEDLVNPQDEDKIKRDDVVNGASIQNYWRENAFNKASYTWDTTF